MLVIAACINKPAALPVVRKHVQARCNSNSLVHHHTSLGVSLSVKRDAQKMTLPTQGGSAVAFAVTVQDVPPTYLVCGGSLTALCLDRLADHFCSVRPAVHGHSLACSTRAGDGEVVVVACHLRH